MEREFIKFFIFYLVENICRRVGTMILVLLIYLVVRIKWKVGECEIGEMEKCSFLWNLREY